MKIYLVRHGQTEDAAHNRYQNAESVLSTKGIEEAQQLTKSLSDIKFDKILCSPLVRAKQTADIINEHFKLPIEITDFLIEEKRPAEVEKQNKDSVEAIRIMAEIEKHYHDPLYRFSDEDTFTLLKIRGQNLLAHVKKLSADNILLVSSGVIMKMFLALAIFGEQLNSHDFATISALFLTSNCGISVLDYSDEWGFSVDSWNGLRQ